MVPGSRGPAGGSAGPVVVTGVVSRRREHGKKLVFFNLDVESTLSLPLLAEAAVGDQERSASSGGASGTGRCTTVDNILPVVNGVELRSFQAVHSLRAYPAESAMTPERFKCLAKLIMPKAVVRVRGSFGKTKSGEDSLFAEDIRILRVQPDPSAVVRILCSTRNAADDEEEEAARPGLFVEGQCWEALGGGGQGSRDATAAESVRELQDLMVHHPSQFRRECASIARQLQGLPPRRARAKPMRILPRDVALLENDRSRRLRAAFAVEPAATSAAAVAGQAGTPALLKRLLKNLPCLDPDERRRREAYLRQKKWPQIQWMADQVGEILERLDQGRGGLRVADVGAGRGDLALALALRFPECQFAVIDVNEQSLGQGEDLAMRMKVRNVTFERRDVRQIGEGGEEYHVFVGLHACGGLTDAILDRASRQAMPASFLVCTCCFGKNKELRPAPFDAAFAAGAAGGEERTLCRLADCQVAEVSSKAMHAVNVGRLEVVGGILAGKGEGGLECEIKSFPRRWSAKNMVLRGSRRRG